MKTAKYDIAKCIHHEQAFNWKVRKTLKKCDRIISFLQKKQTSYLNNTHKFDIEVPKTFFEAYELDKNGKTLLADAIFNEMNNVKILFDIIPDGKHVLNSYKQIRFHVIFDVKMKDFFRKARLVADRHMKKTPKF